MRAARPSLCSGISATWFQLGGDGISREWGTGSVGNGRGPDPFHSLRARQIEVLSGDLLEPVTEYGLVVAGARQLSLLGDRIAQALLVLGRHRPEDDRRHRREDEVEAEQAAADAQRHVPSLLRP